VCIDNDVELDFFEEHKKLKKIEQAQKTLSALKEKWFWIKEQIPNIKFAQGLETPKQV